MKVSINDRGRLQRQRLSPSNPYFRFFSQSMTRRSTSTSRSALSGAAMVYRGVRMGYGIARTRQNNNLKVIATR
jgi:hypothetical protein